MKINNFFFIFLLIVNNFLFSADQNPINPDLEIANQIELINQQAQLIMLLGEMLALTDGVFNQIDENLARIQELENIQNLQIQARNRAVRSLLIPRFNQHSQSRSQ